MGQNEDTTEALKLLKIDLGITHDKRDEYFGALLLSVQNELKRKGVVLDLSAFDDLILLTDYAAWQYRNRQEGQELPKNLQLRVKNRVVQGRAKNG